ncbi:hypothetical protein Mapa_001733 [Marchantia paleacea]|nr:hypothetical protein Mapa_001733 [Marchantia paleacea]
MFILTESPPTCILSLHSQKVPTSADNMAGQHVEKEVVSCTSPDRLHKYSRVLGPHHLRIFHDEEHADQPGNVVEDHQKEHGILGARNFTRPQKREDHPHHHLRKRKNHHQVHPEC